MDKREKRPAPRDTQIKRIRWKYGILDQYARVIAELHYGGVKQSAESHSKGGSPLPSSNCTIGFVIAPLGEV